MTRSEMDVLGWAELDVLLISGDAYVDHPTFGAALLGRWLVAHGYRVGICAQPDWRSTVDLTRMGRPRLMAGVGSGALDSMLAHYTAFKRRRSDDGYTPGGKAGSRPDRAVIVYANLVRQAFKGLPVILGGIEASLRRISHYDFWSDQVRRPILLDAKAEGLVYGMGERALLEILGRLAGEPGTKPGKAILGVRGTAVMGREEDLPEGIEVIRLPSHEEILAEPPKLMAATLDLERQVHQGRAWAIQEIGGRSLLIAPPAEPLSTEEMDRLYGLPFTRMAHPGYSQPIPGLETVARSITSHRGCGGGCSFCSLALHQGRTVRSRSGESILAEAERLTEEKPGVISDIGGPSANMWSGRCTGDQSGCVRSSCLSPKICQHFEANQEGLADLLNRVAALEKVKHLRVASGVRFDLALQSPKYLHELIRNFVGGQLKIAPEHLSPRVLKLMRKPEPQVFEGFLDKFQHISREIRKRQFVVPYLMSGFPGCDQRDMILMAEWLAERGWRPQQVQCFVPTPGSVATAMFHAEVDTRGRPLKVTKSDAGRRRQHSLLAPAGRKPRKRKIRKKTGQGGPGSRKTRSG